ncbi:TRIC cation channel family protein, partial [Streptomyces sp. NPDC057284]|uniref:TRIC cation channel family protein n=1 Tax=Streptomyces sp. NPDC057284 TaxID=3346083 RepID=UPI00362DC615
MTAMPVMSASLLSHGIDVATRYLDLAGVFSCALLGGAVARTVGLDLFGFLVVGIISGLGGGLIRDVLLQHGTPVALTDYAYLVTAVVGSVVVFLIKISEESWNRLFTDPGLAGRASPNSSWCRGRACRAESAPRGPPLGAGRPRPGSLRLAAHSRGSGMRA